VGEERARTRSLGQTLSMRSCSICSHHPNTRTLVRELCTVFVSVGNHHHNSTHLSFLIPDSAVEFFAVDAQEVIARLDDATLDGDGARRVDVVAGNHAHGDPRTLALLDGIWDLREEEEEDGSVSAAVGVESDSLLKCSQQDSRILALCF